LLRSKGTTTVISWTCGDHRSEEETDIELFAETEGIRAFRLRSPVATQGAGSFKSGQNNDVYQGVFGWERDRVQDDRCYVTTKSIEEKSEKIMRFVLSIFPYGGYQR
jgi:hypothetical protein